MIQTGISDDPNRRAEGRPWTGDGLRRVWGHRRGV